MRRVSNPPNPWSHAEIEWIGEPPPAALEVYEERARSVVTGNDSPDLGMPWSMNPYRGCFHGCAYCFARRSHQYLGFGAGTDFERRIVVKVNAPEVLRRELGRRGWKGEEIVVSGNTDCYQPLELSYELTRRCLLVCEEFGNPVAVITKGAIVRRDADVLARLAARGLAHVILSIPFADDALARAIEPYTSRPSQRFETLRLLSAAGVPTGISLAPVIPGLNDSDIPVLLERAHAAGARTAFMTLVRLAGEVAPVFEERLREALPDRADRVLNAIREVRGGALNDTRFGERLHGRGPRWQAIEQLYAMHARRLGFDSGDDPEPLAQPGPAPRQRSLF
ncbi:MAG: PA0069 family radical SAM protein [Acidobacteria bacterium]|nr:PA0069 family radical SAM protein [Acidobacteriota bacterium]